MTPKFPTFPALQQNLVYGGRRIHVIIFPVRMAGNIKPNDVRFTHQSQQGHSVINLAFELAMEGGWDVDG